MSGVSGSLTASRASAAVTNAHTGPRADAQHHPPHPFFEHPEHKELFRSHVGHGFVPLKYAYTGSAAYTHVKLAATTGYQTVVGTARHEVDTLMSVIRGWSPTQIVEVGPGTGEHSLAFLSLLRQAATAVETGRLPRGRQSPLDPQAGALCYLGLDFSETLLKMAKGRLSARATESARLDVHTGPWDLEECPTGQVDLWRRDTEPALLCLLGHTIGNLQQPAEALRHLAASALPGDLLLVGLKLFPEQRTDDDADAILAPYQNDIFAAAVLEPWWAAGFAPGDFGFAVRRQGRSIVGEVTFDRRVDHPGHRYRPGHKVQCFASARFLEDEGLEIVSNAGWTVQSRLVDPSGEHLAVVAKL